jgi:hypothetical protein
MTVTSKSVAPKAKAKTTTKGVVSGKAAAWKPTSAAVDFAEPVVAVVLAKRRPSNGVNKKTVATPRPAQEKIEALGIEAICERLANCETLRAVAESIDVSLSSLRAYCELYPVDYARAFEHRADKLAEDMLAIADEDCVVVIHEGAEVILELDSVAVQRNRLRMDARKWLAGKMNSKKYGDKVQTEGTMAVTHQTVTPERMQAEILELLSNGTVKLP